jgi:hypothetical protein
MNDPYALKRPSLAWRLKVIGVSPLGMSALYLLYLAAADDSARSAIRMSVVLLLACSMGALVAVGSAQAGSRAKDPRVPALIAKVNALSTQLTTVATRLSHDEDVIACSVAVQGDFNIGFIHILEAFAGMPPAALTPVDDQGSCSRLGITRSAPPRLLSATAAPWGRMFLSLRLETKLVQVIRL